MATSDEVAVHHHRGHSRAATLVASFLLAATLGTISADAGIVSYGPVTNRPAQPAIQKRTNRHVVLFEERTDGSTALVVYDSLAREDPREIAPSVFYPAAAREEDGTLSLLVQTSRWNFSRDGGASWTQVALPGNSAGISYTPDVGGPDVRRGSIVVGTQDVPFLVNMRDPLADRLEIWSVRADGSVSPLARATSDSSVLGSDREGARLLLAGVPYDAAEEGPGMPPPPRGIWILDPTRPPQLLAASNSAFRSGWIDAGGGAYLLGESVHSVFHVGSGALTELAASFAIDKPPFAVPDASFSGAWIVERGLDATVLSHHTPTAGLVEAWRDPTRPAITAAHVGASGTRLLLAQGAVAIGPWNVGDPNPPRFEKIAVPTNASASFVHLNVDTAGAGEPFFLDTGKGFIPNYGDFCLGDGGTPPAPLPWSVVRGVLQRPRLVIPAAAHLEGAARTWRTDLVLRNTGAAALPVTVDFAPNPETVAGAVSVPLLLPASSTTRIPDVLFTLFGVASGSGAILLTPETGHSLSATSRTYAEDAGTGTYGMSVDAVSTLAARGPTTPATFSTGLFGSAFRSNLVSTDTGGRGAAAAVRLTGKTGGNDGETVILAEAASTQSQISDLAGALHASPEARTLTVAPSAGDSVAGVIQIDDLTNDPAWMPPDVPSAGLLVVPALVHSPGLRGAVFQSDVSILNPSDKPQDVRLRVQDWANEEAEQTFGFVLQPGESRVLRDVLFTAFARTGVARLRVETVAPCFGLGEVRDGIRVASRTYSAVPGGGSFGMLVPPLDPTQIAAAGDSLEILLPEGGTGFRTNLALVNPVSTAFSASLATVELFDGAGRLLDSFSFDFPTGGQISDLFHARGLGDGPRSGWIRVTSMSGTLAAYATVVDNGTNDPLYAPGVLAATP